MGGTKKELEQVIDTCVALLRGGAGAAVLASVLGVLAHLPLPADLYMPVMELAVDALPHVPAVQQLTVLRALLATCPADAAERLMRPVRSLLRSPRAGQGAHALMEALTAACLLRAPQLVPALLSSLAHDPLPLNTLDVLVLLPLVSRERAATLKAVRALARARRLGLPLLLDAFAQAADVLAPALRHSAPLLLACELLRAPEPQMCEWAVTLLVRLFELAADAREAVLCAVLNALSTAHGREAARALAAFADRQPLLLAPHAPLLEDLLQHNPPALPALHSLCHALAQLCPHAPPLRDRLMVFVQRRLFAGGTRAPQLAIVTASHLLARLSAEDSTTLLDSLGRLFAPEAAHSSVSAVLCMLELLLRNAQVLTPDARRMVLHQLLSPALQRLGLLDEATGPHARLRLDRYLVRSYARASLSDVVYLPQLLLVFCSYGRLLNESAQLEHVELVLGDGASAFVSADAEAPLPTYTTGMLCCVTNIICLCACALVALSIHK